VLPLTANSLSPLFFLPTMDGHLQFTQGQDHLNQNDSYNAAPSNPFPYSSATWPPFFPQDMSDQNGDDIKFHATSAGSLDMKPSIASPLAPSLHSPVFGMSQAPMDSNFQPSHINTSQSMGLNSPLQPSMDPTMSPLQLTDMDGQLSSASLQIRTSMGGTHSALQSADPTLHQVMHASATMLHTSPLHYPIHSLGQQSFSHADSLPYSSAFDMPLHASPTEDYISSTHAQMDLLVSSSMDVMATPASAFVYQDLSQMMSSNWGQEMLGGGIGNGGYVESSMPISNSEDNFMPRSLSSNGDDHSFIMVEHAHGRRSLDGFSDISAGVSPGAVHIRADSHSSHISDPPHSAASTSSMEELFGFSPEPEALNDRNALNGLPSVPLREYPFANNTQFEHPLPSPPLPSPQSSTHIGSPGNTVTAAHSPQESSSSSSSSPSAGNSPKSQRRNSPLVGVTAKTIAKKKTTMTSSSKSEKRVGRRRGPLRPEQREQAHEIRKLRACLRCRFLKKVCDKGNPCGGCQPSHARLWQVPCTRIDIKDIGYFFKDWNADYERHITMGFSIANIKGFDTPERLLYITHGYGFVMPIWAREVFVRDDSCFGLDWVEQKEANATDFEVQTARLSVGVEGISKKIVSDYVDLHLDQGFDHFIDSYFDGTPFLSELLRSINRHYLATKQDDLRKGLRLVIAYALTLHITMINGLTDEESSIGKVDDPMSRYFGETCAPVMINFEVKKAMADLWRELMADVLAELSTLYSAVYAGKKQKSWPTIFMLAALILSVWEMMQFDCHYRVPEEGAVQKFCDEMEHVPVGVVVGLFGAISTKLPGFQEWDANKHGNVFSNDPAVCNTMTEVRSHIEKHGKQTITAIYGKMIY
jgi:hypothetical protein